MEMKCSFIQAKRTFTTANLYYSGIDGDAYGLGRINA